ncbi:MAG TPA: O-antigen ligase family protein, partial [Candidatus Glassbacteria bacterium]|nr:O-antigen ligase family protein [Candidatus Glassbacteria bacterium]
MARRKNRPAETLPAVAPGGSRTIRLVKLFFFAALAAGATVYAPDQFYDGFETPKLFLFQTAICLALLASIIHLLILRRTEVLLPVETVPLVILFVIAALSVSWSGNRGLAVERLFQLGALASCLFFAFWLYRGQSARAVFRFVVFAGAAIAVWSCLLDFIEPLRSWVYPHYLEWSGGKDIDYYRPVISNQGNPNFTLHVLVLTLPAACGLILTELSEAVNRGKAKGAVVWAGIPATGVLAGLICFYLSQNRSGVLSLLFALVVFTASLLLFKRRALSANLKVHWKKFAVSAGIILVAGAAYFTFSNSGARLAGQMAALGRERAANWVRRFQNLRDTENIDIYARVVFYEAGWAMIKDDPLLGKGIGQFVIQNSRYRTAKHWEKFNLIPPEIKMWELIPREAHNEFWQLWIECGLAGLAAFLAFLWLLARRAWKCLREFESRPEFYMLLGTSCGIAGTLANSLFTFPLQTVTSASFFWTSCGLLLAACCKPEPDPVSRRLSFSLERKSGPAKVLFAVAVLAAATGIWGAARIVRAQYLFFGGMKIHADDLVRARKLNTKAADLLPYHFEMQYVEGI